MAYEGRLVANYAFGTLSTAVSPTDTVLSSAEFGTRLPADLTTAYYVPITLHDPETGAFEIVWATAHIPAATTATCVRAREGTTGVAWPTGTKWTGAPTTRDAIMPVASRASLPASPHAGLRVYLQDEKVVLERYTASWGAPAGYMRQNAATLIANATWATVVCQDEEVDNASGHSAGSPRYYTVKQAGRYEISGAVSFDSNAAGVRGVAFWRNGVMIPGSAVLMNALAAGFINSVASRTIQASLSLNDNIEMVCYQSSGGTLSTSAVSEYLSHWSIKMVEQSQW